MTEYTYAEPTIDATLHAALIPESLPAKWELTVLNAYREGHATGHQSGHTAGQARDRDALDRARSEGNADGYAEAQRHFRPADLQGITIHDGPRAFQLHDNDPIPDWTMTSAQARVYAARLIAHADAFTRVADDLDLADRVRSITRAAQSLDDAGIPRSVLTHITTPTKERHQ